MISEHTEEDFTVIVNVSTYKNQDIVEAIKFGNTSVANTYENANHDFAKYYTISFDDMVMATIMLQRDGNLIYFVTTSFTASYQFKMIREVRKLADDTVEKVGVIATVTATFYKEALQFNRIVGFTLWKNLPERSVWIYEQK